MQSARRTRGRNKGNRHQPGGRLKKTSVRIYHRKTSLKIIPRKNIESTKKKPGNTCVYS
jgi:hypothetical protein